MARRASLFLPPLSLFLFACGRSCGATDAPAAADAAPPGVDGAAIAVDASHAALDKPDAAARIVSAEARRAYARGLGEARGAQRAGKLDVAIAAFGRAIAAVPDDARAYAERGFARYQMKEFAAAKGDLDQASTFCSMRDDKLAAQIEFNLGLVCQAIADGDPASSDLHGVASAHFRRSNDLVPSTAAASRMADCPVGVEAPEVTVYGSLTEARKKLEVDVRTLQESGTGDAWLATMDVELPSSESRTIVLFAVSGGRFASVIVGPIASWRCGSQGGVDVSRDHGLITVAYQAHGMGDLGGSTCFCVDEGTSCTEPWEEGESPKCKCKETTCQMHCGGDNDEPDGTHEEIVLDDAGHGLVDWTTDHAFLDRLTPEVDAKALRFRVGGLRCAIDASLPIVADGDAGTGATRDH